MKEWMRLDELAEHTGGQIAAGCRVILDGREGTICEDPYFGGRMAAHFDGTDAFALNITGDRAREILVHRSAIGHTNHVKENLNGTDG